MGRHRQDAPPSPAAPSRYQQALQAGALKVPQITVYFWIVKLLTTAMGEAVSDTMAADLNQYLAVFIGFVVWAVAMFAQFRARQYHTWLYWLAVSMVAVFGTMCADGLHIQFHVPYADSTALFAVLLAITLVSWYASERTLDIHTINAPRREAFYWATVIFTFALGTAVGDLTATPLHLGYLASALIFLGAIVIPLIAWRLGASPVATFWVAYILTRPIGASLADFFGMPKSSSGLGLGHEAVAGVFIVIVVISVWFLAASGKDAQPSPSSLAGHSGP
ncbi:MAG TPA: hypothetical protein VMU95_38610 [Trebonia sp.]|nr:hypothetical protein [Trebonia sp.]